MKVNFLHISQNLKDYDFFEGVDLADLATLIDWNKSTEDDLKEELKGAYEIVHTGVTTEGYFNHDVKTTETAIALIEGDLGLQVDYFVLKGSKRGPTRKKENFVSLLYIDTINWKMALGVFDPQTEEMRRGSDWTSVVSFYFCPKRMSQRRALKVIGGSEEGLYFKGKKI